MSETSVDSNILDLHYFFLLLIDKVWVYKEGRWSESEISCSELVVGLCTSDHHLFEETKKSENFFQNFGQVNTFL